MESKLARVRGVDLARGIAIALMILSHGVKGLLPFRDIPDWGLVPIHLVTKISSTLFILVFGISLAVAHLPFVGTAAWPARRRRLWLRGIEVLFWYKLLTIVEMFHQYSRQEVLDALLYRAFPVYVEILGFYAIALAWVPLSLPLWKRAPLWSRILFVPALAMLSQFLYASFDFGGSGVVQALLVEHESHYTWGQLARAPLVFLGLLLGEAMRRSMQSFRLRAGVSAALALASVLLFLVLWLEAGSEFHATLASIARNSGKHPPEADFMFFSLGGALLVIAVAHLGGGRLASALQPLTWIGQSSLQAFVFHIIVIFVFYRYLLDYWHRISYSHALSLTALLFVLTVIWVRILRVFQQKP